MASKPTFLQTLFNQPSQKYAVQQPKLVRSQSEHRRKESTPQRSTLDVRTHPRPDVSSQPFPSRRSTSSSSSSVSTLVAPSRIPLDGHLFRYDDLGLASEKLAKTVPPHGADIEISPRASTLEHSCEAPESPPASPAPSTLSEDELFYTPLSSPRSSAFMSPKSSDKISSRATASMSSSSIASSAAEDDLFSSPSVTTSATSLSISPSGSSKDDDKHRQRRASYHGPSRSHSRSNPSVAEWSKDVRWLVSPEETSASSSRRSSSTGSIIQGLELVDIEYEPVPAKGKSRMKSGRKSKPQESVRMSAVMEEEEDDDHPASSHSQSAQIAPARARTVSSPVNARRSRPASLLSRSSSSSSRTVTLPSPLPVSSGAASSGNGYTGLTLPRAAYVPSKHPGRVSSTVDITRSGLAQTTMSTISISRHSAAAASSSGSLRFSLLRSSSDTHTPTRLRATMPSPLSFASHTPPPTKVHSGQVLVQVWAVALDGLDSLLVDERAGKSDGFGYVPGRSFVGRAVECGWEVNSVSKGDWVFGMTEVRKCGALSEFLVVDRRRLHRSPRPSPHLTVDQIALLPLAGVPAHRAVRTFAHLPRGSRALVLQAHDGAGLLATQELNALGYKVTAQAPGSWGGQEEKRARAGGAKDVRCGGAVGVVTDVKGEEFDGVVDTLGGKEVWDACRRVLRTSGQFTTLVGDAESGIPTANAHFKSNMRSLRRAFVKKDHKSVGYQWISPAADVDGEGEDVRDSLAAVARMAEDGVLIPHVGRVLPFERAPDAFTIDPETKRSMLSLGGTAVVRIVD